jgi:hypothetical protein
MAVVINLVDIQHPMDWSQFPPTSYLECATPERLDQLYRRQLAVPGYRQLLQQNVTIFGTFDGTSSLACQSGRCREEGKEGRTIMPTHMYISLYYCLWFCCVIDHDYGCNNADRTYPYKLESAKAFCNFIGQSPDSLMGQRAAAGHGVYGVQLLDFARPPGQTTVPDEEAQLDPDLLLLANQHSHHHHTTTTSSSSSSSSNKTVAVFVLDVRTHKTPWQTGPDAFRPDYAGDFLGERQWTWFETAIRRSRAQVNVVVTGLQVHADRFPDGNVAEAWSKYPLAQQRLFDALLQEGVQAPILISGDVHMTQLMRKDCMRSSKNHKNQHVDDNVARSMRSLMELTTSGMTHSWATLSRPLESNPDYKFSAVQQYKTYVAGSLMRLLHWTCPWRDLMTSSTTTIPSTMSTTTTTTTTTTMLYENGGGENATAGLQFSLLKNFGELEFDWEQRTVTMRSMGEHAHAPPLLMAKVSMDQLSGAAPIPGSRLSMTDFDKEQQHRRRPAGEWICINHRGQVNQLSHITGHVTAGAVLTTLVPFPFLLPTYILLILIRRMLRKPSSADQQLHLSSSSSKIKQLT